MRDLARINLIVALAAGLLVATLAAQQAGPPDADEALPIVADDAAAVAIMPFEILSENPKATELADALVEAISEAIRTTNGLRVVDPGRVVPFAGSALEPDEIARVLGVGGVMTGMVRVSDGRWTVSLGDAGWSSFWDVGDAASATLAADRIREVASGVAELVEGGVFPARVPNQRQVIENVRATVLDASLSDAERIAALDEFFFASDAGPGLVEARTAALGGFVAETLAQIALDAEDPIVRYRAWRGLAGVHDSVLIRPLLASLADDSDALVRRGAADRLMGSFPGEPGVEQALAHAAEFDLSEEVRNHIRSSSLPDTARREALRVVALDAGRADRERVVALGQLYFADGRFIELDHELVVAALDIARHADSPLLKSYAWGFLADSSDPWLVAPYLALLADPDEEVRESAAIGLAAFLYEPGVRDALEAAVRDNSIVVRRAAAESIQAANR